MQCPVIILTHSSLMEVGSVQPIFAVGIAIVSYSSNPPLSQEDNMLKKKIVFLRWCHHSENRNEALMKLTIETIFKKNSKQPKYMCKANHLNCSQQGAEFSGTAESPGCSIHEKYFLSSLLVLVDDELASIHHIFHQIQMDTTTPCKALNSVVTPVITQTTSQMHLLLASSRATNQTWDLMLPPLWFRCATLLKD